MLRVLVMLSSLFVLSGCASMPDRERFISDREVMLQEFYNVPSSGESKLDGVTYIRMSKLKCSDTLVLDLYQDTANNLSRTVVVKAGSTSGMEIAEGKSLQLKIDNKSYAFHSIEETTEQEKVDFGSNSVAISYKSYVVPETVVREAAASKTLLARLNLSNGTSSVGDCSVSPRRKVKGEGATKDADEEPREADADNEFAAVSGFKEFVSLVDLTFGNIGLH